MTNTTTLITFPPAAAPEWQTLLNGLGKIGADAGTRAAFAHAYCAGVAAADFCGLQLDAGTLVHFGAPHGPYRVFGPDGEREAWTPVGSAWPACTHADLVSWEAECAVLDGVAEQASRAAGQDGDAAAEPYLKRRDRLQARILSAPCSDRTAALIKVRAALHVIHPESTDLEDVVLLQLAAWLEAK